MKALVGLCDFKSEIESPAMKTRDKMNNKRSWWQGDRELGSLSTLGSFALAERASRLRDNTTER